jgi:nanoRNase/pAp phosphatase (c-di-AMP/oligoRNAs hydrolase)
VSKIAYLLGGGGHKKAAGFSFSGKLEFDNNHWLIS